MSYPTKGTKIKSGTTLLAELIGSGIPSLFTFKGSKDFEKQTLNHIKSSSPFYVHQFAIPNFELIRLIDKFENLKDNNDFNPDIVLINLQDDLMNNYRINQVTYCKVFIGSLYNLYLKKEYCE